jgi:hypothetical protein
MSSRPKRWLTDCERHGAKGKPEAIGAGVLKANDRAWGYAKDNHILVLMIFILSMLTYLGYSESSQEKNLGDIRKELLNTEVIILGSKASGIRAYRSEEVLLNWHIVELDKKDRYKKKTVGPSEVFAPYALRGKSRRIVSIELANNVFRWTKQNKSVDIFGEKINVDSTANPYFDLIVQLKDGKLIMTRSYCTLLEDRIKPVKRFDEQKSELVGNLHTLIGKSIYKAAYSNVYPQDIDVKEVTDKTRSELYLT